MQYRSPVGSGPSSKTCPRCEPHRRQTTSDRDMKKLRSCFSATFSLEKGAKKLGHPVPESNLVSDLNSGSPQQMHS